MKTYTFTEAREKLASVLDEAASKGEVRIKRRDGRVFVIRLQKQPGSPLDVEGLNLNLSRQEILESIAEGRRDI